MSEGHDTSVVAVRQGSQVLSEAEDMTAEFSHRLTVPHSGARSGQPAEFVGESNDESMRAAESPVRVTAAPIHPASPRAKPLFPELARVIG